jgi:aspartyl-tRNA(Asn)/glutamyl-tRNA(Gln) amidotransferase subunit A
VRDGVFITECAAEDGGVRLAVKDLFDTAGVRTTYGSLVYVDHVPDRTASAVTRLEDAGYVSVGKTNLHEFAWGITSENPHYGHVPNPLAADRIAGGSSGGNAVAIVDGDADAGIGSDSGGSIRIPAACVGITGFKPSHGLVPVDGCFPLAPTFDHVGPMAPDVAGCVAMMRALVPGFEPASLDDLGDLRVGVAWTEGAEPLVRERVEAAAAHLPGRARLDLPFATGFYAIFAREAAESHTGLFPERREQYGEDVATKLGGAIRLDDEEVDTAATGLARYREAMAEATAGVDLVLTPTLEHVAPPLGIGDLALRGRMIKLTFPWNATGSPALALPCGAAEDGLPASVQIVGRPGDDALVLAAGALLERSLAA